MNSLKLPAHISYLDQVVAFVANCARSHAFSEDRAVSVELVVEEVFVNVCMYAYEDQKGDIEITCGAGSSPGCLKIEIRDEGRPFNPLSAVPSNYKEVDIRKRRVGGLGILMIVQMTDEMCYDRIGNSNRLTLKFYQLTNC
ncbi:MAG: ATP-binding protein [Pseudomonadota bacterium]